MNWCVVTHPTITKGYKMKFFHFQILIGSPLSLLFGVISVPEIGRSGSGLIIILGLFSLSFLMLVSGITSMLSFKNKANKTSNVYADE
jgi:hypothetical protein